MSALFDMTDTTSHEAYRVLARKYRPQKFEDLIGQEAMVRTLSNAIRAGRLPQAWMLTGVRGIGKTTTARIIARALNCLAPKNNDDPILEPCGLCEACLAIAEDRHVDVQELDAASRTSVDDIREIIDGVKYGPVSARYKIYILDEVHMLSKNAFNALLKTLEEPPPHTKFIFATTEIRKVPVTVLSRCQRFDLRRIQEHQLTAHFGKIARLEKAEADEEALRLIAQAADGSVRDGLSLLDQAIARGQGRISTDDVKDMLGMADRGHSINLCRLLLQGKTAEALDLYASMDQAGSDPLQILQDLCDLIHLLTRGQIIADLPTSSDLSEADRTLLMDLADIKIPALTRTWQILLKGIQEVQSALHPAQTAEMVLIRLAYAACLPLPSDLIKQIQDQQERTPTQQQVPDRFESRPPHGGGSRASSAALDIYHAPASLPQTIPPLDTARNPVSFREIATLFADNREAGLYSQIYSFVHPIRCEEGLLEIKIDSGASDNLPNRMAQCLTLWTNRRWMVSLADKAGEATLAEQDKEVERSRLTRVQNHPLTQAVILSFPDAKITAIHQRRVITSILDSADDDALDLMSFDRDDDSYDDLD